MSLRASSLPVSEDLICCWSSLVRSSVALAQRFSSCLYSFVSDGSSKCDLIGLQVLCARNALRKEAIESIVICCRTADGFHYVGSRPRITNKAPDAPLSNSEDIQCQVSIDQN